MVFQNIIGKNDLSYYESHFNKGFIEYIIRKKIREMTEEYYKGIQKKRAYMVPYKTEDGETATATMTNNWFGRKEYRFFI